MSRANLRLRVERGTIRAVSAFALHSAARHTDPLVSWYSLNLAIKSSYSEVRSMEGSRLPGAIAAVLHRVCAPSLGLSQRFRRAVRYSACSH